MKMRTEPIVEHHGFNGETYQTETYISDIFLDIAFKVRKTENFYRTVRVVYNHRDDDFEISGDPVSFDSLSEFNCFVQAVNKVIGKFRQKGLTPS